MVFEPEVCTTELFLHLSYWALKPGKHSVLKLQSQCQHDFIVFLLYLFMCVFLYTNSQHTLPYGPIFSSNRFLHSYPSSSARPFPPHSPPSLRLLSFPSFSSLSSSSLLCVLFLPSLAPYLSHLSPSLLSHLSEGATRMRRQSKGDPPNREQPRLRAASGTGSSHCPSSFSRWCLSRTEQEELGIWLSW